MVMFPRKLIYEADEGLIIDHFLVDIVGHDRYLRFGYNATNDGIIDYLEDSFEDYGHTNMWFMCVDDNKVVGTVHVSFCPITNDGTHTAELGFTVSPDYRGRGLGQELFIRGATWAMMKGANTLYTQCLSENMVMQHIAKKNGMTVVTVGRGEKEATLQATKGISQAYYDDKIFDSLSFVDSSIHKQWSFFNKLVGIK
jgi:RimJ/RimL family protein N-acetyltransferase